MNSILKRLSELPDADLYILSEAIDTELERRSAVLDAVPESARRRAIDRQHSYRRRTGSSALPIRVAGLGKNRHAA